MTDLPESIIKMYKDRLVSMHKVLAKVLTDPDKCDALEFESVRSDIHKIAGTAGYFSDGELEKESKRLDKQLGSTQSFAEHVKDVYSELKNFDEILTSSQYFSLDS